MRNRLLRKAIFRLFVPAEPVVQNAPPFTPKKRTHEGLESDHISKDSFPIPLLESKTLVVGTEGVQAFVPSTLLSRAESLLEESQIDEVEKLANSQLHAAIENSDEVSIIFSASCS